VNAARSAPRQSDSVVKRPLRIGWQSMHQVPDVVQVVVISTDDHRVYAAHQRWLCAYSMASGGCSRRWARTGTGSDLDPIAGNAACMVI
jgi:hypothetical protein